MLNSKWYRAKRFQNRRWRVYRGKWIGQKIIAPLPYCHIAESHKAFLKITMLDVYNALPTPDRVYPIPNFVTLVNPVTERNHIFDLQYIRHVFEFSTKIPTT